MVVNSPLTDFQRSKVCSVLTLGCSQAAACAYVGATVAQLESDVATDAAFAAAVAKAEVEPVLRHMGNIYRAAQSEKNWRTSAWWLLQYLRHATARDANAASVAHLEQLVDDLAAAIVAEVPDPAVQRRLIERLRRILAGDAADSIVVGEQPLLLAAPAPRFDEPGDAEDAP